MFAAIYQDEGPSEPCECGQSCLITSPWFKVHLFDTADEAQDFVTRWSAEVLEYRRRARWTIASTVEDDGYANLVDHSLQIPEIVERCMKLEAEVVRLQVSNDNLRHIDR